MWTAWQHMFHLMIDSIRFFTKLLDAQSSLLAFPFATVNMSARIYGGAGDNTYEVFGGNDFQELQLNLIVDRP
jgi:hypothetical protein